MPRVQDPKIGIIRLGTSSPTQKEGIILRLEASLPTQKEGIILRLGTSTPIKLLLAKDVLELVNIIYRVIT